MQKPPNSFFSDSNILILDDAHAAENYISDFWSLLIERSGRNSSLFDALVSLIKSELKKTDYQRLIEPSTDIWDITWIEKIPTPRLAKIIPDLTSLLDANTPNSDMQFSWSVLRDHLHACHLYVKTNSILIRPIIPPTLTHAPFSHPKQRIYMSATLGAGGDLERITGVGTIERIPIPEGWDKQGIGRRLFLFPERSMAPETAQKTAICMIQESSRALVLVPDNLTAEIMCSTIKEQTDFTTVDAMDLEQSKHPFVDQEKMVAVLANRYDGLDFIGDECRLLVVMDLPSVVNLQEQFLISRLAATVLLNDRILTRIVQAIGRCTRSTNDYAAVVILGDALNSYFLNPDKRRFFHPEIQAELDFGLEQSRETSEDDFLDMFRLMHKHGQEWNNADQEIISIRESKQFAELPATTKLKIAVSNEVKYLYALWAGNYELALEKCRAVLTHLIDEDVRGYRAFWNYLAGSAAFLGAKDGLHSLESVARDYFKHASQTATGVQWLLEISRFQSPERSATIDIRSAAVIAGLEVQLQKIGMNNDRKFDSVVQSILNRLHGMDPFLFEEAHKELGNLLGYHSDNTTVSSSPDSWWIAGANFCFVFEDHSQSDGKNLLGANKVRQAAAHPQWIENKMLVETNAQIIPVIITPCLGVEQDAQHYANDVRYWNLQAFQEWATKAIGVVRELRRTFPGPGDFLWQQRAAQIYFENELDPSSILTKLDNTMLKDLLS